MIVRPFCISLALVAALASPVMAAQGAAAQLDGVKGDIRIAGKTGLSAGRNGAALAAGDRVVARSGSATLRYADGCVARVPAGAMATIASASPCATGQGLVTAGPATALTLPKLSGMETGAYFAIAGTVLLGAGLIAAITDPASP
jgi:hypothetical protein